MSILKKSPIREFQSEATITKLDVNISEIIGILQQNKAYQIFFSEDTKVWSLNFRKLLKASDPANMKASSLFFRTPVLSPEDSIGEASKIMCDYRLRALPIIENGKLSGQITAESICHALLSSNELDKIRINSLMKKNVLIIEKNKSISKARKIMMNQDIDYLPVLDSGKILGVLSSISLVSSLFHKEGIERGAYVGEPLKYSDVKVSSLMSKDFVLSEPGEESSKVLGNMFESGNTYSLVGLWDELQGIVTLRDFIVLLSETEDVDIPAYIIGLPDDPFEAELAKSKFMREAKKIYEAYPKTREVKCTIRTKRISTYRRRYEVDVSIISKFKTNVYSETGWNLPSIFDNLSNKMKRLLTEKPSKTKQSLRRYRV